MYSKHGPLQNSQEIKNKLRWKEQSTFLKVKVNKLLHNMENKSIKVTDIKSVT